MALLSKEEIQKLLIKINKQPEIQALIKRLSLTKEEQEQHFFLLLDVFNYYIGKLERLKIVYRGINGGIFWSWSPTKSKFDNVWLTEVSSLEDHFTFKNFRWEELHSQKLLEYVRDFMNRARKGKKLTIQNLFLFGPTNTRKTLLTKTLLNFAKFSHSVAFINVVDFQEKIVALDYGEIKSMVNAIKSVELLALDDLGAENINDFFRDSILYKIIASRETNSLPIIYTSSFSTQELFRIQSGQKATFFTIQKAKKLVDKISSNSLIIPIE